MSPLIKEATNVELDLKKLLKFIEAQFGSFHAFKLLKYFFEHKLARENSGFATYEICFNISPSIILRDIDLINIECLTDDSEKRNAEIGLYQLLQKKILKMNSNKNS